MKRAGRVAAHIVAGLLVSAMYALPQAYTVSARPGAVNYVEGEASINGKTIEAKKANGKVFLNANDTLSTENGKAEVLLTPGVFLRVGADSEVKMVSPELTLTQVQLNKGSAIIEVDQLVKENNIQVLDGGATIKLQKTGLYSFTAGNEAVAQVLDGKADVSTNGQRSLEVGRNHEVALNSEPLKREKLNSDTKDTPLYAWSKVRDEYEAAASYASARTFAPGGSFGMGWGAYPSGYGFAPGWAWNPFWGTYAWLPGDGAFFSPFGFGYFAPAYIAYAPVVTTAVGGRPVAVPVSTSKPGVGTAPGSKAGYFDGKPIHYANGMSRSTAIGSRQAATAARGANPGRGPAARTAPAAGGFSRPAAAPAAGFPAGGARGAATPGRR